METKQILLIAIVLIGVVGLIYLNGQKQEDVLQVNLKEHTNLELHIHPIIEIEILGEKQLIPAGIGVSNKGMRVIHTHESDGTIHIESPYPHQFYLKDFFTVWEKEFNEKCIFDKCVDSEHSLKVYVNGIESKEFGEVQLKDGEKIRIVYSKI